MAGWCGGKHSPVALSRRRIDAAPRRPSLISVPESPQPDDTLTGASIGSGGGIPAPDPELLASLRAALAPTFTIVRHLGAGGMGSVFLARDAVLRRLVAVKALAPATSRDATDRQRFQREAQAVAAIAHPNVVAVYSVGETATGARRVPSSACAR